MFNVQAERSIREVAMQLLEHSGGAFDLYSVFTGNRLGLFAALDRLGPATAGELSSASGLDASDARRWLDVQVENGFVQRAGCAVGIRYRILPSVRSALLDVDALEALAPRDCLRIIPGRNQEPSHGTFQASAA